MEAIEHQIINHDWLSILLAMVLLLLVFVKLNYSERFRQLVLLPVDNAYILNFQDSTIKLFNFLFFLISHSVISLLIFQSIVFFHPEIHATTEYLFFKIVFLVFTYSVVKNILDAFLSFFFDLKALFYKSLFVKWSYFFSASIFVLSALVFAIYNRRLEGVFLYISWAFLGLFMLVRYYHFIRVNKREIFSNLFYFILYLCALEIAPLLIVVKFVVK